MIDATGLGYENTIEQRGWRDRTENRLGRLEAQQEHGTLQHERHREDIRDISLRMERMFEKVTANLAGEIERASAATRLQMAEQLSASDRAMRAAIEALSDDLKATPPAPAPASVNPTQIPWKVIGLVAVCASACLLSIGIAIGLSARLGDVVSATSAVVTP
jgi:hypothetical protein